LKFLIDSMLAPSVAELLEASGHDATTPAKLGAHNLPDEILVELATAESRGIVTQNASDFATVTGRPVLFVRKSWWPSQGLAEGMARALDHWALANADPGPWAHWLHAELR
jgi:predicted nuclease of predicted toxin-antitoxin system